MLLEQEQSKKAMYVDAAAAGDVIGATWVFQPCQSGTCTSDLEVWAAIRRRGSWGVAVKLASGNRLFTPRINVAQDGRALVVWGQDGTISTGRMFAAVYDGTSWAAPLLLNEDRDRKMIVGKISDSPEGWELLWMDRMHPIRYRFWKSLYSSANGWSDPVSLGGSATHGFPLPSMSDGSAPFFLREGALGEKLLVSQKVEVNWSPDVEITPLTASPQFSWIAALGNEATVVWATDHVFSRRFTSGVWESTVQLDAAQAPSPLYSREPYQAPIYLSNGTVLMLWTTENEVWQTTRPARQSWGPAFVIDATTLPIEGLRFVGGGRRAIALWRSGDVIANEYNDATGWRGAGPVELEPLAVSGAAVVYDSSTNTFVAIWLQGNAAGLVDVVASSYR